jgi:hypothetical protein
LVGNCVDADCLTSGIFVFLRASIESDGEREERRENNRESIKR